MNYTVNLSKEKDFKKTIEFIAEEYYGSKGHIFDVLTDFGFGTHYKEEYDFMDLFNIIEEDENEDYEMEYKWFKFDEMNPKAIEFFLGIYHIIVDDSFDRMGDMKTRLMIKLDPNAVNGCDFVNKVHRLNATTKPIAVAIDNSQMAVRKYQKMSKECDDEMDKILSASEEPDVEAIKEAYNKHKELLTQAKTLCEKSKVSETEWDIYKSCNEELEELGI